MPVSSVFVTGTAWARVAGSAPVTVTVAPTMIARLGSTTVTRSVAVAAGCANARVAKAAARHRASSTVFMSPVGRRNARRSWRDRSRLRTSFLLRYLTSENEEMSCPNRGQCVPQAVNHPDVRCAAAPAIQGHRRVHADMGCVLFVVARPVVFDIVDMSVMAGGEVAF